MTEKQEYINNINFQASMGKAKISFAPAPYVVYSASA
jgi:hypothetical protein